MSSLSPIISAKELLSLSVHKRCHQKHPSWNERDEGSEGSLVQAMEGNSDYNVICLLSANSTRASFGKNLSLGIIQLREEVWASTRTASEQGDKDVPSSFTAASPQPGLILALSRDPAGLPPCSYHGRKGGSGLGSGTFVNPGPPSALSVQSFRCLCPGRGAAAGDEDCVCWQMAKPGSSGCVTAGTWGVLPLWDPKALNLAS